MWERNVEVEKTQFSDKKKWYIYGRNKYWEINVKTGEKTFFFFNLAKN